LLDRLAQESAELDETAMDRQAKLLETLSDILKKLSYTERQIVLNLK
jgi:hypothetical protein